MQSSNAPIIGITTYARNEAGEISLPGHYLDAVEEAGGIPILLPPHQTQADRILDIVDGLIFAGGGDIDPSAYGGEHHPTIYLVDGDLDQFELTLAKAALSASIPTLGICRGMQILSVASGAKLIPHVPDVYGDAIAHRLDHPRRPTPHLVQLEASSRLATIMQAAEVMVESWHHQAVQSAPPGWKPAAYAADGLVEALERVDHPWMMAVQWHPELSPHDPAHQRIFQALVEASRGKVFEG
ncbi:MAG: gamma-glutamyl-gamma-aminobutyrate hydrolase family protein [Leptolyngbyaceae cyanobacterium bins.302]|nr:gamma-glutamyl-gamma-aminobutyrate hydrolase family protein [Leptolyngbyaceae cyanobacterium bins.302]